MPAPTVRESLVNPNAAAAARALASPPPGALELLDLTSAHGFELDSAARELRAVIAGLLLLLQAGATAKTYELFTFASLRVEKAVP